MMPAPKAETETENSTPQNHILTTQPMSTPAATRTASLTQILSVESFTYIIVCCTDASQAQYWTNRLESVHNIVHRGKVICTHESDWNGNAGNGLGTLYAFECAQKIAQEKFNVNLQEEMSNGASLGLYHIAGKGTRLAPLPGSEINNKPGVQLPGILNVNGVPTNISILEAVIKQTGIYASSRPGRLSVFWGDQIFVPSISSSYTPTHEIDIMCTLRSMPSAEEWASEGLDKYGLIAVNAQGNAAQVEKVSHATATELLKDGVGTVVSVGTSLGSFSVSTMFILAMMEEYKVELEARAGSLDTDPHFWMPLTLSRASYLSIMKQKGVNEEQAAAQFDRMAAFATRLEAPSESKEGTTALRLFGAVDVGRDSYWWDYGQLRLYFQNNILATQGSEEASALRQFLGLSDDGRVVDSDMTGVAVDGLSCVLSCRGVSGSVVGSCLSNVTAGSMTVENSLCVNVTAKKIVAKGALLYNVVDDSDDGIVLGEGQARADVLIAGERVVLLCDIQHDGRVSWKTTLPNNSMSFEEVWKKNQTQNVIEALKKSVEAHAALRATL